GFVSEVESLHAKINGAVPSPPRYLLERLILDTTSYLATAELPGISNELISEAQAARERLKAAGLPVPAVEALARYQWAAQVLKGVITRPVQRRATPSDRIDRFLTNRLWGTLVFLAVMLLIFQAVFYVAEPASATIDGLIALLGSWIE